MNKPVVNSVNFDHVQDCFAITLEIKHDQRSVYLVDYLDGDKDRVLQRGYELCSLWKMELEFPKLKIVAT